MTAEGPPDISGLIAAWGNEDEEALNRVGPLLYLELRRNRAAPPGAPPLRSRLGSCLVRPLTFTRSIAASSNGIYIASQFREHCANATFHRPTPSF